MRRPGLGQVLVQLQHRLDQTDHPVMPLLDRLIWYRVPVSPPAQTRGVLALGNCLCRSSIRSTSSTILSCRAEQTATLFPEFGLARLDTTPDVHLLKLLLKTLGRRGPRPEPTHAPVSFVPTQPAPTRPCFLGGPGAHRPAL